MYFDDLAVGQTFETEPTTLSEEAIIAFARQWDPQPFHLDPEAAAKTHFGGLIASGFHTMLTAFVGTVKLPPFATASMGSPGMEEVKWLKPVRPGDSLSTVVEVISLRESSSRPDRGYALLENRVLNQEGAMVMSYRCNVIFAKRPA
ncbi:MaoC family dehydratase [Rhodobacteraceae bacterium NNCM2]|nr:MaoC family dehydratase [Coraliihabitans acroporae]